MRFTILPLSVALVVALAAPVAAHEGHDHDRVFFPADCERNVYKPKTITVACADAGFLVRRVSYDLYGEARGSSAMGSGTASINDCEPNCARGRFRSYPVDVTLSHARQCGDVLQFTRLKIEFTGRRPSGQARAAAQRRPCADAPT